MTFAVAVIAAVALVGWVTSAAAVAATVPSPAWSIQALAEPTVFKPGDESGLDTYEVFLTNSGGKVTDQSPITITDTLPAGLGVKSVELQPPRPMGNVENLGPAACETKVVSAVSTVTCEVTDALLPAREPAKIYPGNDLRVAIHTTVPLAASGSLVNAVTVEGGGAEAASGEIHSVASGEEASAGFEEFHAASDGFRWTPVDGRGLSSLPVHDELRRQHAFPRRPAPGSPSCLLGEI